MSDPSPQPPSNARSKRGKFLVIAIIALGVIAGVVAVLYWKFGVTVRKIEDGKPQRRTFKNSPKAHALLCMGAPASARLQLPLHP
jgi:hypothetical protein